MRKAVLYARVSSDMQEERTIESQIVELKKEVTTAGHVLVKEYVDDGYSGARLDRSASSGRSAASSCARSCPGV